MIKNEVPGLAWAKYLHSVSIFTIFIGDIELNLEMISRLFHNGPKVRVHYSTLFPDCPHLNPIWIIPLFESLGLTLTGHFYLPQLF